ncbi:hypothetical protein [Kiloniella sp.]|uniref:hypothetical protein n=1 Tax=Kiloniella sp. TaxID=1938587 RepID=UPI003B01F542
MTIVLDVGLALRQATLIEKGLRAGAFYASQTEQPMSAGDLTAVENLVKTGTLDGTGDLLVPGWGTGGTFTLTSSTYTMVGVDPALGSSDLPVVNVNANVPYSPMLPGLWDFFGVSDFSFNLSHEQAYVGL